MQPGALIAGLPDIPSLTPAPEETILREDFGTGEGAGGRRQNPGGFSTSGTPTKPS